MNAQMEHTQEQSLAVLQAKQESSNGGTATIQDNRPGTVLQRKLRATTNNSPRSRAEAPLRETMKAHASKNALPVQQKASTKPMPKALPIQRKTPKGSSRFQQIASAMGDHYGVDTSGLEATHNSSFPTQLNAEATLQGNKIHFAPGNDTDDNIWHEVAYAIDNTLNGTPRGNYVVNGQTVDTTREKVVDRMSKEPVMQRKEKVHNLGVQRDTPVIQAKFGFEIETKLILSAGKENANPNNKDEFSAVDAEHVPETDEPIIDPETEKPETNLTYLTEHPEVAKGMDSLFTSIILPPNPP